MIVLDPPLRLKLAVSLLFMSIPIAAIEVAVARQSPWWRLPFLPMTYWAIGFLLVCAPLAYQIISGRKWAFWTLHGLFFGWTTTTLIVAWQESIPMLGFYGLFVGAFCIACLTWLSVELGRSFLDPRIKWYEGLPPMIPGLTCQLTLENEDPIIFKVGRLDLDGTFVFVPYNKLNNGTWVDFRKSQPIFHGASGTHKVKLSTSAKMVQLAFEFKDRVLICVGTPVTQLGSGIGIGLLFNKMSSDLTKEVGDFVEALRGEGYA